MLLYNGGLPGPAVVRRLPNCLLAPSAGGLGVRTPCCICGWPTRRPRKLHRTRRFTMRFQLDRYAAPLSQLIVVTDDNGALRALEFADHELRMQRLLREH